MQMQYFRTARALVQIVHVLRDHGERRRMRGQSGDGQVRGVRPGAQGLLASPFIPAPDQVGMGAEGLGVARACASKRDHSPVSASRNVAMPLSAETPAPVKTTGRLLCRRACASGRGCRAASRSSRTGASGARGKVGGVMHVQPDRWFTTLPVRGHACQAAEQSPCLLQSPRAAHGHCACGVPNRGYWGQDFGNINGARADSPAAPDLGD